MRIDSVRVSVNFTGLPSRRATRKQTSSSGVNCSLPPKPPPTSGAITRIFDSGTPVTTARKNRTKCGTWVEDHTVICSAVGSTTVERGSMNAGTSRCWRNVRSITMPPSRAVAIAASTSSPVPASDESNTQVAFSLVPRSGWASGAPSSSAVAMSRHAVSSS